MNKTLKYVLIIVLPLILILLVGKKMAWFGAEKGQEVETAEVEKRDIVESVIASGKIQPEKEVKISPEVSGEIIALPVTEGSEVSKGDLLLKINPDIFLAAVNRARAAVNSARAGLASAKAQFIEAKKNFERNRTLAEKKVISSSEFDAAQRAYDVARLSVESAKYQLESTQASLKEAQDNLERTTIYAPQTGTVSRLNSELGERVVGTAQMAGTEIMRIANLEAMEVLVEVNENDIIRVALGDTALIEVDAYLDRAFKGVVSEIANSANIDGQSVDQITNFEVKVRMLSSSYQDLLAEKGIPFRPGMTASLEILTKEVKDAIAVPIQAVTTRTDTSRQAKTYTMRKKEEGDAVFEVVFLEQEGEAVLKVVKTGIQDDAYIQITEGLEPGQSLIVGPYSIVSKLLRPGDKVQPKEERTEGLQTDG